VIRDDPEYYPYRYGGRNVVTDRPAHPGPRFVFRDADPRRPSVSRGEPERRRGGEEEDAGRTSEDVGGRGAVAAPRVQSLRRRDTEAPPKLFPARPLIDERRRVERRREAEGAREPRAGTDTSGDAPEGLRPSSVPRSTGEPELRRRSP
jgi:hypothetical protein